MQITFTPQTSIHTINAGKKPSFCGLLCSDPKTKAPIDSWFFRDFDTLKNAAGEIKHTFPNGTEILDFASSNGEEVISLKALLPENQYKITGYDTSEHAIKLARKGFYTVFSNWYDSFLLPGEKAVGEEIKMKEAFHTIMQETFPTDAADRFINNKVSFLNVRNYIRNFREKFFRINDKFADDIDIRRGDILKLDKFRTKETGAIFFRNALYHIAGNDISERLSPSNTFSIEPVNKLNIINELVDKIYNKLEKGGIFVIGDHIKDHLFVADNTINPNDTICFKDTPFYDPERPHHRQNSDLKLHKKSPLTAALEKGNRFVPIGFSFTKLEVDGIKIKVPTIWKKIM